jgi:hypothetical protein
VYIGALVLVWTYVAVGFGLIGRKKDAIDGHGRGGDRDDGAAGADAASELTGQNTGDAAMGVD